MLTSLRPRTADLTWANSHGSRMVAPVQEEADAAGMPRLAFMRKGWDDL
jgi:hypothetical protein